MAKQYPVIGIVSYKRHVRICSKHCSNTVCRFGQFLKDGTSESESDLSTDLNVPTQPILLERNISSYLTTDRELLALKGSNMMENVQNSGPIFLQCSVESNI